MSEPRRYPEGVPCWVDLATPDSEASQSFYGGLFGWQFHDAMPPGAPGSYVIATLDGQDAAAIAPAADSTASWMSYIACDDVDASARIVAEAGAEVVEGPEDAGPGGRLATVRDPQGAVFRLWQAKRRLGAQIVNQPNAWAFTDLHTHNGEAALRFYGEVFAWVVDPDVGAGMIRLPGYGDRLAATADPEIFERQRGKAPEGFADVVAALAEDGTTPARWGVRFVVTDLDASVADAEKLGGAVRDTTSSQYTREATIADPQGATFVLSQVTLPD
ncbi:VOC family protein [Microbacterium sp. 10M-3C3]|jgi:predicted enzyme related to lactoylglutathione lyase|uniref:VOC family protein n=1 Tax=Microbacterium sp. 10M-3C3 TaxID=2483401 RepID=UPI000F6338BA|nr:VOC family protein [Microbacterium sp. 10M-3C3]